MRHKQVSTNEILISCWVLLSISLWIKLSYVVVSAAPARLEDGSAGEILTVTKKVNPSISPNRASAHGGIISFGVS